MRAYFMYIAGCRSEGEQLLLQLRGELLAVLTQLERLGEADGVCLLFAVAGYQLVVCFTAGTASTYSEWG